jgi:lipopolysaccharide/colanic/teichoic acid biosynthesis glycosyltransferase
VVRPGLTGFAQVRRGYETSMAEKLAHDLEWIADRSVPLYLRTLAATALRIVAQTLRSLVRSDH